MRLVTVLLAALLLLPACESREARRVRAMPIGDVNLATVSDGAHRGTFTYGGFTYEVETVVRDGRIERVRVLQNRDSRYAKMAVGVADRIVARQTPNVDAVSGATTTSKALMKAVENSLTGRQEGVPPAE